MAEEKKEELTKVEALRKAITDLDTKDFKIHFFVLDTKGNATGAVANIYEHVKMLREHGYDAGILHEDNTYTSVESWLGSEYDALPHIAANSSDLSIGPQDFIIIPEIFSNIMEQTAKLPAKRVVLCQSYDYILEMLMPGAKWSDHGITDCITTTNGQKEFIDGLFKNTNTSVIPVGIPDYFKQSDKPAKPIVAIHTRDQRDSLKVIKAFYLKYPQYKWVSFRDMRGLSRTEFAKSLSECCAAVWIDDIAGFGTFPIEAMKCGITPIGKAPSLLPEWLEENDSAGAWTHNHLQLPDMIASYFKLWLEDDIPGEISEAVQSVATKYTMGEQSEAIKTVYSELVTNRKAELEAVLEKEEGVETASAI